MKMRHEARLIGERFNERSIRLYAIDRRKPQTVERGDLAQDGLDEPAERRGAIKICPVRGEIAPGQNDLAKAFLSKAARGLHGSFKRQRARGPARVRDNTKSAAVIAAALRGEKGPCVILGPFAWRERTRRSHDVRDIASSAAPCPCCRIALRSIAEHLRDFRHGSESVRSDLRRAARHDNFYRRPLTLNPADRLARLARCFRRHRAGVDNDEISPPCGL